MYKLSDLLELAIQPRERARMRDYLKRGTVQQLKLFPNNNPEEFPGNTNKVVGFSWDEDNTLEEMEMLDMLTQAVKARELQSLEDVRKMIKRLQSRGISNDKIMLFIKKFLLAR